VRPGDMIWEREYTGASGSTWFFVANPGWLCLPQLRLGNEGQELRWMKVSAFLGSDEAVPHLQQRLGAYLDEARSQVA